MTPPGQANEVVAVVEHDAFARLYREELAQEGLPIDIVDVDKVPTTTVSIFPDPQKDATRLDIAIPRLTAANQTLPVLGPISEEEVRQAFSAYSPLPVGKRGPDEVPYEGRHLITGEVVEHMKVSLALLDTGFGAISYYVQELEYICKVRGTHQVLAPLLQMFLEEILFGKGQSLFDSNLVPRLSDSDVREHVRAVFVPIIRRKTLRKQIRTAEAAPMRVNTWRPFQVTVSERHPVVKSAGTIFNLIPCNRSLEQALVGFLDKASDVDAFTKNAGPQALRIDYLAAGQRLGFYVPDFFIRAGGSAYLVETKGQEDREVPTKARAAVEWCKSASNASGEKWEYVFIQGSVFDRYRGNTFAELARVAAPSLADLINERAFQEELPLFAAAGMAGLEGEVDAGRSTAVIEPKLIQDLPERVRKAVDEAVSLYLFFEKKPGVSYAPVFTALLGVVDESVKALILQKLQPHMPTEIPAQKAWFDPYLAGADPKTHRHYQEMARNLKKTIVFGGGVSLLGLARNCLDYALNDKQKITGVFEAIREGFRFTGARDLLTRITEINDFRNSRVAHQEQPLENAQEARTALVGWVQALRSLRAAMKDI